MMPFFIIGISAFFAGFGWLFAPEPWLLDESANVILLDEQYENLFADDINRNLPKISYAFVSIFGWWVSLIGLLTLGYTYVTRLGTKVSELQSNYIFHWPYRILIILLEFIPTSPFLFLNIFLWLMWAVSVYAGLRLSKYDH